VIQLVPTFPHTRAGLAIMLEHGAAMHWIGAPGLIELDRDIASPQGAFVPGGPLALIFKGQLILLDVTPVGVQSITRLDVPIQRTVGICATSTLLAGTM
jgi:hypothetical protein